MTATALRIETLRGAAIGPVLADLARLRSTVFRAWPYLYEGDGGYESEYLRRYVTSAHAAVVVARDGEAIVGAATCLPLAEETAAVAAPFRARGWPLGSPGALKSSRRATSATARSPEAPALPNSSPRKR